MGLTTLCYIEKENKYLMLHRIVKKHDINKDKWIGVGGHFEHGESPEDCMFREVREETGLVPVQYRLCGVVTFLSDMGIEKEAWEYMFLYHITDYKGTIKECDEGVLEWVPKKDLLNLELWEGDRLFLRYMDEGAPFFSLKLTYVEGNLMAAVLDGKPERSRRDLWSMRTAIPTAPPISGSCAKQKRGMMYCFRNEVPIKTLFRGAMIFHRQDMQRQETDIWKPQFVRYGRNWEFRQPKKI